MVEAAAEGSGDDGVQSTDEHLRERRRSHVRGGRHIGKYGFVCVGAILVFVKAYGCLSLDQSRLARFVHEVTSL